MTIKNIQVWDAVSEKYIAVGVDSDSSGPVVSEIFGDAFKIKRIRALLPNVCSSLNHDQEYCALVNAIKSILNE